MYLCTHFLRTSRNFRVRFDADSIGEFVAECRGSLIVAGVQFRAEVRRLAGSRLRDPSRHFQGMVRPPGEPVHLRYFTQSSTSKDDIKIIYYVSCIFKSVIF